MAEVFGKNPVSSSQFPVVLFDAGGTLLHFNPPLEKFIHDQLAVAGQARPPEEIERAWIQTIHKLNLKIEQDSDFVIQDDYWFREIFRELNVLENSREDLLAKSRDAFAAVRVVVAQPVIELCETLRERGFRLGIVSNWDHRLPEILRLHGILDLFEVVITAGEKRKPDAAPFREALEDMDVSAKEAIHVGESFAFDVVGAQRAGLKAILYDPTYRELKALAETTTEALSKVVPIDILRQNRRLSGVKVITKIQDILDFLI